MTDENEKKGASRLDLKLSDGRIVDMKTLISAEGPTGSVSVVDGTLKVDSGNDLSILLGTNKIEDFSQPREGAVFLNPSETRLVIAPSQPGISLNPPPTKEAAAHARSNAAAKLLSRKVLIPKLAADEILAAWDIQAKQLVDAGELGTYDLEKLRRVNKGADRESTVQMALHFDQGVKSISNYDYSLDALLGEACAELDIPTAGEVLDNLEVETHLINMMREDSLDPDPALLAESARKLQSSLPSQIREILRGDTSLAEKLKIGLGDRDVEDIASNLQASSSVLVQLAVTRNAYAVIKDIEDAVRGVVTGIRSWIDDTSDNTADVDLDEFFGRARLASSLAENIRKVRDAGFRIQILPWDLDGQVTLTIPVKTEAAEALIAIPLEALVRAPAVSIVIGSLDEPLIQLQRNPIARLDLKMP